jgi:hypothetical protein
MHVFERFSTRAACLLIAAGALSGCAPHDSVAEASDAVLVANGTALNGVALNGVLLNGLSFNGLSFNGLSFNGLSFNGLSFNGLSSNVSPGGVASSGDVRLNPIPFAGLRRNGLPLPGAGLDGSALRSVAPDGTTLRGADLVGVEIGASLTNGHALTLRIDAVTPSTAASDVLLYTVSLRLPGVASLPLCGTDPNGNAIKAIPLSGAWDPSAGTPTGGAHVDDPSLFTFACEGFALAKCVELGYAPWRTVKECKCPEQCHEVSLAPLHQACTRMLRADYCGDGTATTRNGTEVDTWDAFSIQTDAKPSWFLEAEWGANGATCVAETRWPTIDGDGEDVRAYIQDHCAARWQPGTCGGAQSSFFTANGYDAPIASRALLRSRIDHD